MAEAKNKVEGTMTEPKLALTGVEAFGAEDPVGVAAVGPAVGAASAGVAGGALHKSVLQHTTLRYVSGVAIIVSQVALDVKV